MKKQERGNASMVQSQKPEKLYYVTYGQIRKHSRVLYIPLDPTMVRLNRIKKFDIIKYSLLELRRAPEGDEEE
jgi:hypothetical protein